MKRPSNFQLPLSGSHDFVDYVNIAMREAFNSLSRDHLISVDELHRIDDALFQLPLSGSRTLYVVWRGVAAATFNSLSRDHQRGPT